MGMTFGIVQNGEVRTAGPAQIEAHVAPIKNAGQDEQRSYAYAAIRSWPPAELELMGIYPIRSEYTAPGSYQYEDGETYTLEGGEIVRRTVIADLTLEEAKAKACQDMAAKRYYVEVGGITVGGMPVATDRDTQAKLIAVRILAKEDASYTVTWKGPAGFVVLDAPTIIAVADAVSAHVQAAFNREAELTALIEAAETVAEVRAINIETGWSA